MRYLLVFLISFMVFAGELVDTEEMLAIQQDDDGTEDYQKGEHARQLGNYRVMLEWFRKSAAKGHGKSANMMGLLYLRGEIVEKKDPDLAVSFFETAASKGETMAHGNLGYIFERGMGVPVNFTAAIGHFRRGVEAGGSQFGVHLARLLLSAERTELEREEGARLAAQAAASNNPVGVFLIGTLYEKGGPGYGVNVSEALAQYQRAVDMQHVPAITRLAELHHSGNFTEVPRDDVQARRLAERAAHQGDSNAMALLGFLCGAGLGGSQDIQASVLWTRRAANSHHALAKANLEIMKKSGFGMPSENDD